MSNARIDAFNGDINAPVGRMEWLRADSIRPWGHQRDLSKAAAYKIAREFDPDTLGTLTITRREGVNYLLDGQHRLTAIRDILGWGDQNVPCVVYEGLTDEQEAKLFTAQAPGKRRQLSPLHAMYVEYQAGVEEVRSIVATVERAGLGMGWAGNSKTHNKIAAATALRTQCQRYGQHRLYVVLTTLREGLGPNPRAYSGGLIQGMMAFYIRYDGQYNRADMIERLRAGGIDHLNRQSATFHQAFGGSQPVAVGRAIHQVYNKNRSARRLPDWEENFILSEVKGAGVERQRSTTVEQFAAGQRKPSGAVAAYAARTAARRAADSAAD